jgi:hypothetical protein
VQYERRFYEWALLQTAFLRVLTLNRRRLHYTGQLKKKVTLSHVYNEVTSEPTITRYAAIGSSQNAFCCVVAILQNGLPWRRRPQNTFPRQLQAYFESFPNNCCISRDCRLTGYFIINMWKCYLLFELPCISKYTVGMIFFIIKYCRYIVWHWLPVWGKCTKLRTF